MGLIIHRKRQKHLLVAVNPLGMRTYDDNQEGDQTMDEKMMNGCTGNCRTCASACGDEERGPGFFEKLEAFSEYFSEVGEENLIKILNDTVTEWEKEEQEELK